MTDSKERYKEILVVKGLTCSLQWYLMMFPLFQLAIVIVFVFMFPQSS